MPKPIDLTGREFGYLKVVRFAGISDKKVRKWECKCKCGNIIYVRVADLTSGNTKSCGCLQKEIARKNIDIKKIYENIKICNKNIQKA